MSKKDPESLQAKYPHITIEAKQKKRKKGIYGKMIVALCILLAVGYTGFCLWMQYRTGTQPEPQLTIAFFAFITVELLNMAGIKKQKNKQSDQNREDD